MLGHIRLVTRVTSVIVLFVPLLNCQMCQCVAMAPGVDGSQALGGYKYVYRLHTFQEIKPNANHCFLVETKIKMSAAKCS